MQLWSLKEGFPEENLETLTVTEELVCTGCIQTGYLSDFKGGVAPTCQGAVEMRKTRPRAIVNIQEIYFW